MKIKKTLIIAGALVLALNLSACGESEYRQGYEDGYSDGERDGYEEGLADGQDDVMDNTKDYGVFTDEDIQEAYSAGYDDCLEEYGIIEYYG